MFRKTLQDKLSKIFDMRKTTYDAPSDAYEQDTLFIEVQNAMPRVMNGKATAKVTGQVVVFSQNNKLPFGFFAKRLLQAAPELTKDFFFFDMDTDALNSEARRVNITERRASFIFLFADQYDPSQGSMESIQLEFSEGFLDVGDGRLLNTGDGKVLEV